MPVFFNTLKIKRDTNQHDFKIADLRSVNSELFSLTWSCESRQRETTSSGWKFQLNNLAVKGLEVPQKSHPGSPIASAFSA